jgi:hypothetical protein
VDEVGHRLIPGTTAYRALWQALGVWALAIVAFLASLGASVELWTTEGTRGAAILLPLIVAVLGVVAGAGAVRRAAARRRSEFQAGYSTLTENDFGFERRDPRTGETVEPAARLEALGRLAGKDVDPIQGGIETVPSPGGFIRTLRRDIAGMAQFVSYLLLAGVGVTGALLCVSVAVRTQSGIWELAFFGAGTVALLALLAAAYTPVVCAARAHSLELLRATKALSAWSISADDDFGRLMYLLPATGTRGTGALVGGSIYIVVAHSGVSFWVRRDAIMRVVLTIPARRIKNVSQVAGRALMPAGSTVVVDVIANNLSRQRITFGLNMTGWLPNANEARRFVTATRRALGLD